MTEFNGFMNIHAFHDLCMKPIGLNESDFRFNVLLFPYFARGLLVKSPDDAFDRGNLSNMFKSHRIITLAIPAKRDIHVTPPYIRVFGRRILC